MKYIEEYNQHKWSPIQAKSELVKRIELWRNQTGESNETIWDFLGFSKTQYLAWTDKGLLPDEEEQVLKTSSKKKK